MRKHHWPDKKDKKMWGFEVSEEESSRQKRQKYKWSESRWETDVSEELKGIPSCWEAVNEEKSKTGDRGRKIYQTISSTAL